MVVCCRRTLLHLWSVVQATIKLISVLVPLQEVLKFRFLVYFSLVVTISVLAWFGVERSRRVEDARGVR